MRPQYRLEHTINRAIQRFDRSLSFVNRHLALTGTSTFSRIYPEEYQDDGFRKAAVQLFSDIAEQNNTQLKDPEERTRIVSEDIAILSRFYLDFKSVKLIRSELGLKQNRIEYTVVRGLKEGLAMLLESSRNTAVADLNQLHSARRRYYESQGKQYTYTEIA